MSLYARSSSNFSSHQYPDDYLIIVLGNKREKAEQSLN